jgi:hypothetical protein
MCISFVYHHLLISSKTIFILTLFLYLSTNADEDLSRQRRAIGGESLDTSNFVLYIDDNGVRFVEVPYEYMTQWLNDQKMWRTVKNKKCLFTL